MSRFEFNATFEKSFEKEGKFYVRAVASDSLEDLHGERVTENAIKMMANQVSTEEVALLPTHKDTFDIGHSVSGEVEIDGDVHRLVVEFELDEDYVQAKKLFKEVSSGKPKKQLSIGGFIPLDQPEAVLKERRSDGSIRRALNKVVLDHVALTRKSKAANSGTHFRSALIKALDAVEEATVEDVTDNNVKIINLDTSTPKTEIDKEISIPEFKSYPLEKTAEWAYEPEDLMNTLATGGKTLALNLALAKNADNPVWLGVHHKVAPDNIIKTYLSGVVNATEQLLNDQWNGGAYGLSAEKSRQCAEHLISHYAEFGIEPPIGLYSISKGNLGNWTSEAKEAWETTKESILGNLSNLENKTMADETKGNEKVAAQTVEAEKGTEASEKSVLAKAVADFRTVVSKGISDTDKAELTSFLDELAVLTGLKKETVVTENKEAETEEKAEEVDPNDPREKLVEGIDLLLASQKTSETSFSEMKSLLKASDEAVKTVITSAVKDAVDSIVKEFGTKFSSVEKRLEAIEKLEGVSTATVEETNKEVDEFSGIFSPAVKMALNKFKD